MRVRVCKSILGDARSLGHEHGRCQSCRTAISTDFYVALDNRPSLSFGPYAGLEQS